MPDRTMARHDGRRRVLVATGTLSGLERADSRARLAQSVDRVTGLMTETFGYEKADGFGLDLTASQFRGRLRHLCHSLAADDLLVLYHTGHADLAGARHRLWMSDSVDRYTNTVPSDELAVLILADTPLRQALVILDTCHAGHGGAEALVAGMRSMSDPAGTGEDDKSVSLIAAAHPREQILPGTFAHLLERAVAHPSTAGHEPPYLPPSALVSAVDADAKRPKWQTVSYSTLFQTGSDVPPFFPNPRYDQRLHGLDLATQLRIEQREHYDRAVHGHFLPRARGTDVPGERAWRFVGRHAALEELADWLTAARDGADSSALRVVTGDPGSGKSAVLARLVLLADRERNAAVPRADLPAATVPPVGCIDVTVHARGLAHDEILNALASHTGSPVASAGRLAARLGPRRMVAVIDALDEALDPESVIDHVLRPLAESGCGLRLLVGTRSHLLDALGPDVHVLNLDAPAYADPASLRAYVERCLKETHAQSPYARADAAAVTAVADAVAAAADRSFLVALIVSRTLASRPALPPDPLDPKWRASLPKTAAEAMRQDLDIRLGDRARQARDLLTPLAFALGAGLPWEDVWAPLAGRITGRPYSDDDLIELRRTAGSYIVEDRHHGHSVYRLYHEALAEALREDWTPTAVHGAITEFLTEHTPRLSGNLVDWFRAHPYAVSYLATHAARSDSHAFDTLLLDPLFLLVAAAPSVLAETRYVRSTDAAVAAAAFRRAAHRLPGRPPGEALSVLGHTARRLGADVLAERVREMPFAQPWHTDWAHCLPETPHQVLDHVEAVRHVACVHPARNRPFAVAVGEGGALLAWDLATGHRTGPVVRPGRGRISAMAAGVLSDGRPIAVLAGEDKVLRAWDLTTGEPVGRPMRAHSPVTAVAVPALGGGKTLAISGGREGEVCLWDVLTGRQLARREEHAGAVHTVAFVDLPDGGRIGLSAGLDRHIRVWDLQEWRPVGGELGDHGSQVKSMSGVVAPGGRPVVVASTSAGTLHLWDLTDRTEVCPHATLGSDFTRALEGHGAHQVRSVAGVAVSPDQLALLCAGTDETVRLWEMFGRRESHGSRNVWHPLHGFGSGSPAALRGHVGTATTVAATTLADGSPVAVSGGTDRAVRVWDLTVVATTPSARDAPGSVEALLDVRGALHSNAVFVLGADGEQFRDAATGQLIDSPHEKAAGYLGSGEPIVVTPLDQKDDTYTILVRPGPDREAWRGVIQGFRAGLGVVVKCHAHISSDARVTAAW